MSALVIENLCKTYRNGVKALKGVDLTVQEGDFFALLGPNGAGKSTTIGIVTSLVRKTSGKVSVFSHDLDRDIDIAKSLIGVVPQEFNFSIFEKVYDIVINQAGYYGIPRHIAKRRAEHYLKQLDLWDKRNQMARTLSGGMKRRLMIARALVHEPKLLILDEPTAGVDIEIRRSMWDFFTELNKQGTTIILTTHYLEEAENLCRNIAIINNGSIIRNASMKSFLREMDKEYFLLDLAEKTSVPQSSDFDITMIDDMTWEVALPKAKSMNDLFAFFSAHNINIASLRNKSNRLEELFLDLTKREMRHAN